MTRLEGMKELAKYIPGMVVLDANNYPRMYIPNLGPPDNPYTKVNFHLENRETYTATFFRNNGVISSLVVEAPSIKELATKLKLMNLV